MHKALVVLLLVLAAGCGPSVDHGMIGQADEEYGRGNYLKAESLYERYLEAEPQGEARYRAWERLADIADNVLGDQRKAATVLEAAYLEFSDSPGRAAGMLWRLARIYTDLRDWDKATEAWGKLLSDYEVPQNKLWEVYWNLGKIHQFQGRYAQAKESMHDCMNAAPDDGSRALCLYELAQAYSFLKNREQAQARLEQLLAMQGADEELKALAAYLLAEQAEAEGDVPRARELLESIRSTYPNPKVVDSRLRHLEELK
ncbi:tetratricopeptide repeat protein [Desulfocurvus sp. DL9XJH121]